MQYRFRKQLARKTLKAIDCPVLFPYTPNAVLILPGVVPHFFAGASAGVFTNAEGGMKGCIAGTFVHGITITLLPALLMTVLASNCV